MNVEVGAGGGKGKGAGLGFWTGIGESGWGNGAYNPL